MFLRLIIVAIIPYMKDKNNISDLNAILDSAQATKEELRSASKNQKDESLKKAAESIDSVSYTHLTLPTT
mgnify:CR=1 FL=1